MSMVRNDRGDAGNDSLESSRTALGDKMVGWLVRMTVLVPLVVAPTVASAASEGQVTEAGAVTAAPLQRPRTMLAAQAPASTPVAEAPVEPPQPAAPPGPGQAPRESAEEIAPPPAPRVAGTAPVTTSSEPGIHRSAAPPAKAKFEHKGFTTDLRIGTLGCVRGLCSGGHNVRPGFRVDGFLGGNIRGWVDFGLAGGWGSMTSSVAPGTNVLSLYGLDPFLLQQALGVLGGQALGIDLTALTVDDAKLRAAQAGPLLRVHFIPRGRFLAYVGSGVQYNLFRARYSTAAGDAKIDFHGLAVPIEAAFGVQVHEHVSVGVQFDYLWTWYALANLKQGGQALTVPVRILDEAARMQNSSLRGQLPQFWTFGLMLRARV
jgi:hypothetical protein